MEGAIEKLQIRRKMRLFLFGTVFALLSVIVPVLPADRMAAHPFSAAYTTLEFSKSITRMVYSIDELSVIELAGGDVDRNGMLDEREFDAVKETLVGVLQEHVVLRIG